MNKYWLYIICWFFIFTVSGQELHSSINKKEIKIGEPFTLTYKVIDNKPWDSINYLPQVKSFSGANNDFQHATNTKKISKVYPFEIRRPFSDTSYQDSGKYIWMGQYQLTAWDSAFVVIPPEKIKINDSIYQFPPQLIHITSPQVKPTQPIYDIKESFTKVEAPSSFIQFLKNNWWWLGGILILIVGFLYFIKRRNVEKAEVISLSAREKALQEIKKLEKSKLYEENLKEYYFNLSFILKRFLAAHFKISILDKTTPEIEHILKKYRVEKAMLRIIKQLLRQSDMVKFAKHRPEKEEILKVTNTAREVVNKMTDWKEENE